MHWRCRKSGASTFSYIILIPISPFCMSETTACWCIKTQLYQNSGFQIWTDFTYIDHAYIVCAFSIICKGFIPVAQSYVPKMSTLIPCMIQTTYFCLCTNLYRNKIMVHTIWMTGLHFFYPKRYFLLIYTRKGQEDQLLPYLWKIQLNVNKQNWIKRLWLRKIRIWQI
jgi:hypothetical protein